MDSYTTELEIVPHETQPSRKIKVHQFQLQNFHMHTCIVMLSRLLKALIKVGSNNASVEAAPRDIAALRLQFSGFKAAWEFAVRSRNSAQTAHEHDFFVLIPTMGEIYTIKNKKLLQVALHVERLIQIALSSDSARLNSEIGEQTRADIESFTTITEQAMDLWIGAGSDSTDVGLTLPVLKALGHEKPDTDLDAGTVREPSPESTAAGRPDVPDVVAGD